mgnify:CR=1 FL=1
MTKTQDSSRINYIDALSGLASIRTVLVHSLANFFVLQSMSPYFLDLPSWARLADLILRHSVPVFVFAAGFRYQMSYEKHPDRGYVAYARSRIKRMAVPFLLWTVFYYYLCVLTEPNLKDWNPIFTGFPFPSRRHILNMLTGSGNPAYQFWFLPMLFLVNLLYPLIVKLPLRNATPLLFSSAFYGISWYLDLQHPYDYPKFILFYEFGAMACRFRNHPGISDWMHFVFGLSAGTTLIVAFIKHQTHAPVRMVQTDAVLAITILGLLVSSFHIFQTRIPRCLVQTGKLTWPIYILHDPLLLRSFGLLFISRLEWTHALFFPLAGILAFFASILIHRLIVRMKLQTILF